MLRRPCLSAFLLLGACAAPAHLPRAPLAPPPSGDRVEVVMPERSLSESAPARPAAEATPAEPALRTRVLHRTVIETVEVPVEVQASRTEDDDAYREQFVYDDYLRDRPRGYRRTTTPFPVSTVIGAGVGAVIGHQRGHRGRGALIGSGIGLLFDLHRWSR